MSSTRKSTRSHKHKVLQACISKVSHYCPDLEAAVTLSNIRYAAKRHQRQGRRRLLASKHKCKKKNDLKY